MIRAITSFGWKSHKELIDISRPSFQAFVNRHGYNGYFEPLYYGEHLERPPAWYKIPLLINLLKQCDEVIFFGADTLIVDGREDFNVPSEYWQAMVNHHTPDGEVPNDDVWLVRKPMLPYLEKIWKMTEYTFAPWWEQSALMHLMGYNESQRPTRFMGGYNELYEHSFVLAPGWNIHCRDTNKGVDFRERVQHATMYPDRALIMREWAKQAETWINE